MRRALVLTVLAAMLMADMAPAMAQTKPHGNRAPRVKLIPPSVAAQRAQRANQGAKLLGIKPSGNGYVATMRKGNSLFRVRIPGG